MLLCMLACTAANDVDLPQDTEVPVEIDWEERDRDWETVLAELELQVEDPDIPGIAVAVVLDGVTTYADARGVIGYDSDEAVTAEHLFRWASVSKMHTALGALMLEEQGAWDRDDPITAHVDFQMGGGDHPSELTLDLLLRHHGALPDELDWSCTQRLESFGSYDEPYYGEPGAFYNYSNTGLNLTGRAIEELTGDDFPDWMKDNVLDPIGMVDATFLADDVPTDRETWGYGYWNSNPYVYDLQDYDCPVSRPAAWLHGSVYDLAKTAEVFLAEGAGLVSTETALDMRAQADTQLWADGAYQVGYGLFSYPYKDGVEVIGHDGWVTGYVSEFAFVPEHDFAVVVVANSSEADTYGVMATALDAFLDLETAESDFPSPDNDVDSWASWAGTYVDPHVWGTIEVEHSLTGLEATFTDYGISTELYQYSGRTFWFSFYGSWYLARFIDDPDVSGHPRWFVVREGVAEYQEGRTATPTGSLPSLDELRARLAPFGSPEPVFDRRPSTRW